MKVLTHSNERSARRPRLIWACGVALLLGLLPALALACTPPPGGLPVFTIAQRVQAADVVLEGDVTQMSAINFQNDTATISVTRYFKGSGPASVTITNFGPTSICRSPVQIGDHWVFFAKGDPNAVMMASYLSQFDAVTSASADTIAQILAALNIRARAFLPLLVAQPANIAAAAPSSTEDHTLIGLALMIAGAGVLGLWLRFPASRA
jgi:hypothetical protein